jgi:hypothetical protein
MTIAVRGFDAGMTVFSRGLYAWRGLNIGESV